MTHVGCEARDTEMEQSEFYFAATVLAWVKTMIMFFGEERSLAAIQIKIPPTLYKCERYLELFSYKLKLNKIAARWPAKAVAQFSTFSKKGSDRIVPR